MLMIYNNGLLLNEHFRQLLGRKGVTKGKCTQMSNIYYGNNILQIRQTGQF